MAEWIESHVRLAGHRKTKKLARLLDIDIPQALGYLHLFWYWCWDYAGDGDLSKYDPEDIADGVMWHGEPERLVGSLVAAGWIDRSESGELNIHDWSEYGGKLLAKKVADARRKKDGRAKERGEPSESPSRSGARQVSDTDKTSDGRPPDGQRQAVEVSGERRGEEKRGQQ